MRVLEQVTAERGKPHSIRVGNGPEFISRRTNGITKDEYGGTSTGATNSGVAGQYAYYGQTDSMPIAYTALSPTNGTRQKATSSSSRGAYKPGLLSLMGDTGIKDAVDGTSNTAVFLEDAGRSLQTVGSRDTTAGGATAWYRSGGVAVATPVVSGDPLFGSSSDNPQSKTVPNRWADPDNASGVSAPPNAESATARTQPIINNNKNPLPGSRPPMARSVSTAAARTEPPPGPTAVGT